MKQTSLATFLAFPDIAADIINALLYEGDVVVWAESLLPASMETLYSGGGEGAVALLFKQISGVRSEN